MNLNVLLSFVINFNKTRKLHASQLPWGGRLKRIYITRIAT